MGTIICVGGLVDCPKETFAELRKTLENKGHLVVIPDTEDVHTHQDRITLVMDEYRRVLRESRHKESGKVQIFLVGQSAGGSAVRVVAEELHQKGDTYLKGVVLLSPAMPRSLRFRWLRSSTESTRAFFKHHFAEIMSGKMIDQTAMEFEARVAPLADDVRDRVLASRQPVPGAEMRTLALWPPRMRVYLYPTLHLYGAQDSCIDPVVQGKFGQDLESMTLTDTHVFVGAGHALLGSSVREEVVELIARFIDIAPLGRETFDCGGLKIWDVDGE